MGLARVGNVCIYCSSIGIVNGQGLRVPEEFCSSRLPVSTEWRTDIKTDDWKPASCCEVLQKQSSRCDRATTYLRPSSQRTIYGIPTERAWGAPKHHAPHGHHASEVSVGNKQCWKSGFICYSYGYGYGYISALKYRTSLVIFFGPWKITRGNFEATNQIYFMYIQD